MFPVARARYLEVEWIGFGRRNDYWYMLPRERPFRRPWVAEIVGTDSRYGLVREYLDGDLDFTRSDSRGCRGVYVTYVLDEGAVYEADYLVGDGWERARCYLAHDGARWQELHKDEVVAWANAV